MKKNIPHARRGPGAAARREQILSEFKASGLSAYAFARKYPLPYTTIIQWLRRARSAPKDICFTEVELPAPASEPLILEVGAHVRLRLTSSSQMSLAVQLIKLLQA